MKIDSLIKVVQPLSQLCFKRVRDTAKSNPPNIIAVMFVMFATMMLNKVESPSQKGHLVPLMMCYIKTSLICASFPRHYIYRYIYNDNGLLRLIHNSPCSTSLYVRLLLILGLEHCERLETPLSSFFTSYIN